MTEQEKKDFAARYNVDPQYVNAADFELPQPAEPGEAAELVLNIPQTEEELHFEADRLGVWAQFLKPENYVVGG